MMLESTLSEEKSKEETRLTTNPHLFKDSLPRRDLEERLSTRETRRLTGTSLRLLRCPMRSFSLNTLRKRKLLTRRRPPQSLRLRLKPKLHQQRRLTPRRLPQLLSQLLLKPPQPRKLQRRMLRK